MKTNRVSIEELRQHLAYDPDTGLITDKDGCIRGTSNEGPGSYVRLQVFGVKLYAHRIAWALHYGEWPSHQIDHKNGTRDDNRITNLRLATHGQNSANRPTGRRSATGLRGAYPVPGCPGAYEAIISINNKLHRLGRFTCPKAAHAAYRKAAVKHHGEFARFD